MNPNANALIQHVAACDLTPAWIGLKVAVGSLPPSTLSDYEQHPTAHRTVIYLDAFTEPVDVSENTTITRAAEWGAR